MCLYPKLKRNPKYLPNKKNNWNPPIPKDERVLWVPIGCGQCIECRKKMAREWQVRLQEEMKNRRENSYFITLSFSEESLEKLEGELKKDAEDQRAFIDANSIAILAVHRFRERWRKKYKKAPIRWLATELGDKFTERLHLHGIIWTRESEDINELEEIWKYGNVWIGKECNAKTVNYIVKYITKQDEKHRGFKSRVLASNGIGEGWIRKKDARNCKYTTGETNETYRLPNGAKVGLPIYFRNKVYTEEERERLWIEKLDKDERYVLGERIRNSSNKQGEAEYFRALEYARLLNKRKGYGDNSSTWNKKSYRASKKLIAPKKS